MPHLLRGRITIPLVILVLSFLFLLEGCSGKGRSDKSPSIPIDWVKQAGTIDNDVATDVVVDAEGNTYVAGRTSGDLDEHTSAGDYDLFLVKYNSSGVKQWSRQIGMGDRDLDARIAVDNSGNLYLAGAISGSLATPFLGGTDLFLLLPPFWDLRSRHGTDIFLMKFSTEGNKEWVRQFGSLGFDRLNDIAADDKGGIYLIGTTTGSFDGYTQAGQLDLFITKFNSAGQKEWLYQYGSNDLDFLSDILIGKSGQVYTTGFTLGVLEEDLERGCIFFRYDADGNRRSAVNLECGLASVNEAALDDEENLYTIRVLQNSEGFAAKLILVKHDASGVVQWTRELEQSDRKLFRIRDLLIKGNNLYVTGESDVERPHAGLRQKIFLLSYDLSGEERWFREIDEQHEGPASIALDTAENLYVAGQIDGRTTTRPNDPALNVTRFNDFFLMKFNLSGIPDEIPDEPSPALPPSPPVGLTAAHEKGWITLDWAPVAGAAEYTVYMATTPWDRWSDTLPGARFYPHITGNHFVSKNLVNGTSYYFAVSAANEAGGSLQSEKVSVTVPGWVKQMGTIDTDKPNDVAVDSQGNIYITEYSSKFDSSERRRFVKKFDSSGIQLWVYELSEKNKGGMLQLFLDSMGNVYVTGWTDRSLGNIKPGDIEYFLIKLDSSGQREWTKVGTKGYAIAIDHQDNIYIAGAGLVKYNPDGEIQWDREIPERQVAYSVAVDREGNVYVGASASLLVRYDSAGNVIWMKGEFGLGAPVFLFKLGINLQGNIYAIRVSNGYYSLEFGIYIDPEDVGNIQIVKYDPSGEVQWRRSPGWIDTQGGSSIVPSDLVMGNAGDLYIGGKTTSYLDGHIVDIFESSEKNLGRYIFPNDWDLFLIKYNSLTGEMEWARQIGSDQKDDEALWGLTSDSAGNIYMIGNGLLKDPALEHEEAFLLKYDRFMTE